LGKTHIKIFLTGDKTSFERGLSKLKSLFYQRLPKISLRFARMVCETHHVSQGEHNIWWFLLKVNTKCMQPLTLHNCLYLRNLDQKVSDFGTLLDHVHDPRVKFEKKLQFDTHHFGVLKTNPKKQNLNIKQD